MVGFTPKVAIYARDMGGKCGREAFSILREHYQKKLLLCTSNSLTLSLGKSL